ncbi:hypothetical protein NDN08_007374 [Rhodosorus marinus]|uniref:Uncharacterized protein n=1 Tax=Rhodosorus marinus TaxID=101924 RepID=A0AAV8UGB1_9RHOD|nr:hypothetical protein NDN08_007374 [Rhodosorus marinus]
MKAIPVLLLGLMAVVCLFVETKAQNLQDEICVPLDTFEDVVNGLLGTIHLDWTNIGPYNKKNRNWIKQKSWVSLGALGRYTLPAAVIKHKRGSKIYYEHINKWGVRKGGFSVKVVKHKKYDWALRIKVVYESDGDEIIVKCYDKKTKKPCKNQKYNNRGQLDKVTAIIHAAVKTEKNSPILKLKNYHSLFKMESKFGKKLLEKFGDEKKGWVGKNKKPLRTVEDWVLGYLVDGALTELLFNFDVNNLIDGYLVDQKKYDVGKLLGLADVPFVGLLDKKVLEKLDIVQATKKKNSVCLKYKVPLSALFS